MITFVLLGNVITRVPNLGTMLYVERSAPTASALCFRRIEGARQVKTEYFSILDGGEDILLDNFEDGILALCNKLTVTGMNIGSAKASSPSFPGGRYMHHAVVCRTGAFMRLKLPQYGQFHFETMVYEMLMPHRTAYVEHNELIYTWIPSVNGAHSWVDTRIARENSTRWARTPLQCNS